MPRIRNKVRGTSKRHIIGRTRGGGGAYIVDSVDKAQQDISNLLQKDIYDSAKLILPVYYGLERYKTADPYAPLFTVGTANQVSFPTQTLDSTDLSVQTGDFKEFYPRATGTWNVSCFLLVTLDDPATTAWTVHELHLYKNGAFYSYLDIKPTFTQYSLAQNYHFPLHSLQGTDNVYLTPNDKIEIRYVYSGDQNFGALDLVSGYINIEYQTNQNTEV